MGNLVCPTDFDLGENMKAMILSVPEGDDKPLKYPGVFQASSAIVLNKIDEQTNFIQSQRIPFSKIRLIEYKNNYLTSLSKYENLFASID